MEHIDYTSKIVSKLPYWFAIKKRPTASIGRAFLKTVGLELEEMFYTLDYIYDQLSIDTADVEMIHGAYKTILPDSTVLPLSNVTGNGMVLTEITSIRDFYNYRSNIHRYESLKDIDGFFVDTDRKILYSRKHYDTLTAMDSEGRALSLTLNFHSIWNYFDEFGLLLSTPRIFMEDNLSYKNRLKDVFRNPSSSTHIGLINGIARELGLRTEIIIDDSSKDLELQETMIFPEYVQSGNTAIDSSKLIKNTDGKYVLLGDSDGERKEISYIHSMELHAFHDFTGQEDIPFENELFYSNGEPTQKLKEYSRLINELCPIMWNYARWDESYWIKDMSNFGYVPNLCDASIKGFE